MRISAVFLAGFMVIGFPGVVAGGWLAAQGWAQYRDAQEAEAASRLVSDVQRAQTAVVLEIGQINVLARIEHPALNGAQTTAATAGLLDSASRNAVGVGLDANIPREVSARLAALWQELARYVETPLAERDPAFIGRVVGLRESQAAKLTELSNAAAKTAVAKAPSISPLIEVATLVGDIRDAAGQRSIVINTWLGGQPVTRMQTDRDEQIAGAIEQGWRNTVRIIDALSGEGALKAAAAQEQQSFIGRDEPRWRNLVALGRARGEAKPGEALPPWPEDVTGFRAWGIPGLANIVTLRDVALDRAVATSQELSAAAQRQAVLALALVGLATAITAAAVFLLLRRVVFPLQGMTQCVKRIAGGDLAVAVPCQARRDEIGDMAGAVQILKDTALHARAMMAEQAEARTRRTAEDQRVRDEAQHLAAAEAARLVVGSIGKGLERLAAGDLTFRLETALPEAYEQLRTDLNSAIEQLHSLVQHIAANTAAIRSGTADITGAADDLSHRTETQAASLEQTAAALERITATVSRTALNTDHARTVVAKTRADAEQSGQVVTKAVTAMGSIEQSSNQISQIIGVIDEIAFQTRLLALNAGVEAARAGEAGRGFAVVASEVRALAQRSADAAREIKDLISTSTQQVGEGVKLVGETGQALERVVAQVGEISAVFAEIAASAQEQASGLHQVNTAINQMDQVTKQNAAMVQQTTTASHTLAGEASQLAQLTQRFRLAGNTQGGAPAAAPATRVRPMATPQLRTSGRGGAARKPAPAEEAWEEF